MYYETRCVFYIPSPEARGYKTHNSFHNTSYGMKIHLRSYIYGSDILPHAQKNVINISIPSRMAAFQGMHVLLAKHSDGKARR